MLRFQMRQSERKRRLGNNFRALRFRQNLFVERDRTQWVIFLLVRPAKLVERLPPDRRRGLHREHALVFPDRPGKIALTEQNIPLLQEQFLLRRTGGLIPDHLFNFCEGSRRFSLRLIRVLKARERVGNEQTGRVIFYNALIIHSRAIVLLQIVIGVPHIKQHAGQKLAVAVLAQDCLQFGQCVRILFS